MKVKTAGARVIGVQLVCEQCPRHWWMSLVPAAFRPRSWHPRRLAGLSYTPDQGDWTAMQQAEAVALAEAADRQNAKVADRHRRRPWRRFHSPATEVITETPPASAGAPYAAPFEYTRVAKSRAGGA